MTDLKIGDRVKVEFESVVTYIYSGQPKIGVEYPYDDTELVPVPLSSVTKLADALPTAIGSVIRITDWYGPADWTATLRGDENWHISQDSSGVFYSPTDFLLANPTWEAIYVPGVTK